MSASNHQNNLSLYKTIIGWLLILVVGIVVYHYYFLWMFNRTTFTYDPETTANWESYSNQELGFKLKYPPKMKVEKDLRLSQVTFSLGPEQYMTVGRYGVTRQMLKGTPDGANETVITDDITINGREAYAMRLDNWLHQGKRTYRPDKGLTPLYRRLYLYQDTSNPLLIEISIRNEYQFSLWNQLNKMVGTIELL